MGWGSVLVVTVRLRLIIWSTGFSATGFLLGFLNRPTSKQMSRRCNMGLFTRSMNTGAG